MRTGILCNECYKPLTKKEASVYPIQWQYSGDMYCEKHEDRKQFKENSGIRGRMERNIHQNTALFETCQWLCQQYKDEKKSVREIAKMLGCGHTTVWRWLKKFGIKRRF